MNVLLNKFHPNIDTHHASLKEFSMALDFLAEARMPNACLTLQVLQALCWRHSFVRARGTKAIIATLKRLVVVGRKLGWNPPTEEQRAALDAYRERKHPKPGEFSSHQNTGREYSSHWRHRADGAEVGDSVALHNGVTTGGAPKQIEAKP